MMHALVIDDNSFNRDVLLVLLENEGLKAVGIESYDDLPGVLEEHGHFDVIFLDLEMPTADGFEVFALLRSRPDFASVPIVAYTVHSSEIQQVREVGFNGFIGKPINASRFPQQLERILKGEAVWETS